ncbi:DUF6461 domain-containing protein [Streptomyces sp. NPDC004096]|uniref:DUF6461 domain-containing protein n=1 Tax=Streptomyces sp. NPDC057746 TaxID=3346237 RepID=UPI0036BB4228
MASATAADYGWTRSSSSGFGYALDLGYTLALVRGVRPDAVLGTAGAEQRGVSAGLGELIEQHEERLLEAEYGEEVILAGACTVRGEGGDWTLALVLGGDPGSPLLMDALSTGTRAVSHSSNGGKPLHFFHWYENGELRTMFEWPQVRSGSTPDELNAVMREVGLDPTDGEAPGVDRKAAVFALTERLTGVRVTDEVLAEAEFLTGHVLAEPAGSWESVTVDITDAHGERTLMQLRRDQL